MNQKEKSLIFHCNFLGKNRRVSSTKNSFFSKNHRGTDKIISVYWFVILFVVAGAVVYMAGVFYGNPYDVREVEANVLINKIADCIAEGGKLKAKIIDDQRKFLLNNDTFLGVCSLNFNVEDFKGWKDDQHYVEISFYDFDAGNELILNFIKKGNINLKGFCERKEKNCVERSFYVLDKKGKSYEIKILVVVRKTEKNV